MKGTALPSIARRMTLEARLLHEIALVEEGIRRESPSYDRFTTSTATAFRQLTLQLMAAVWLLKQPETSQKLDTEIRTRMICLLRRFRNAHLDLKVAIAA